MQGAEAKRQPITGRRLGDFVVHELLGAGGQGEVYRAEQPALEREAVIKTLTGKPGQAVVAERFLREARLASRLDHPYAAHVYASGVEPDGLLWIAMELVRGITLSRWLETEGPVPLERFVPLLERVCEVVHTAHEQGIIHRDLKPGNIMVVSRAGRLLPKLLDFGIAKAMVAGPTPVTRRSRPSLDGEASAATMLKEDSLAPIMAGDATLPASSSQELSTSGSSMLLTADGALLGSPAYMAPELWQAAEAGIHADIYALGALSYECLTGNPPFDEPNLELMARAHAHRSVPPLGHDLPPGLDAVIARAMAKDPADRHASVLALAREFADASGLVVPAGSSAAAPGEVLDGALREAWIARAPTMLAEIFPHLSSSKSPAQVQDAVQSLIRGLCRTLGILSLACRSRMSRDSRDSPVVIRLVQAMRARTMAAVEWVALASELTRPFLDRPDVYPVPELIALLHRDGRAALDAALATAAGLEDREMDPVAVRPSLEALIGACEFLLAYRMVVARRDSAESWMGVRRFHRPISIARRRPLRSDEVVLVDDGGYPILSLWPLAQVAAPTPDRSDDVFLFAGGGTHGARLVSEPHGFERHDEGVWTWFAEHRLGDDSMRRSWAQEERHPYRALLSLTREDAEFFFGREREIDALLNRLRINPLAAVVGASGVGKSSFVQAGLVPALGSGWQVVTARPGPHPLAALEAALARAGCPVADLRGSLEASPGAVRVALASLLSGDGVLLVIDQLEEIFTLCDDERERDLFAAALVETATDPADPIRVVVTLRDDFLVKAEQLPVLRGRITRGMQLLTTPHEEDLVRILEEPAARVGYSFEDPDLPREMVREVERRPSALALLSFAASKLWEERDRPGRKLTRAAHAAIGGVAGALAQHADRVVQEMPAEDRPAVREIFQQLFTAEGTRAIHSRSELIEILGRGADGERVLDRLIAARLLVSLEGAKGQAWIEVAHEALLHAWPRLAEWRREDVEGTRRRDQLHAAARQWRDGGRRPELLWRGDVLTEHTLWRKGSAGRLSELEADFLDRSSRDAARARRIRRAAAIGAASIVLVGALLLLWSNRRTEAQRQAAEGERRAAQASADEARARLVELRLEQARQSHLSGRSIEALSFLREVYASTEPDAAMRYLATAATRALDAEIRTLRPGGGAVTSVRNALGGRRVVTSAWDGPAVVFDAATGERLYTLAGLDSAHVLDVSGDGALIAAGSPAGAAVWQASTGELVARIGDENSYVACIDVSGDGDKVMVGTVDGVVRLYRVGGPAPVLEIAVPGGMIHVCELSHDGGSILATTLQARVFSARTGQLALTLGEPRTSTLARFSPDGKMVVTFSVSDPALDLWDARSGSRLARLRGHAVGIFDASFSSDGRRLATAGRDRTAKVWDARDGALHVSLPHPADVRAVAFSAAGDLLATSAGDRRIRIWQAEQGRQLGAMEGHLDLPDDVEFSPDGGQVYSASRDGTARVWRSATSGLLHILRAGEPLFASTFSGDGRRVLTYSHTGKATVWDLATGARLLETGGGESLMDPARFISVMDARVLPALDEAGRRAALPTDGGVAIVDVDSGERIALYQHPARVMCARFSPGDRWLATADIDGVIRLWDVDSGGGLLRVLDDHPVRVGAMDFSPDGTKLARGDMSGRLRIWDLARGEEVYSVESSASALMAIAFSPDGERIAAGGLSRPIKIWSARRPEVVAALEETESTIGLDYAPDGARLFAIHSVGQATVWDAQRSALLDRIGIGGAQGYWVEISRDGARALLTSQEAEVWDVRPYQGSADQLLQRVDRHLPTSRSRP
jgi:WD40 repeat protein/serine/threonine protein kinase